MRKRIYRISEDKFDDLKPNIVFEREELEETCYLGQVFKGTLSFTSDNDVAARGLIYCDNPYVTLSSSHFDGVNVSIEYTVKDISCKLGEQLKGSFTIITVGLEKKIPFTITYIKKPLNTSTGIVNTLQEFADFAQSRFSEAVALFYSKAFADWLIDFDEHTRLLYRGFKSNAISSHNLDEFLVACGLKKAMSFDLEERVDTYYGLTGNIRGEVEITRSSWGFIDIAVSSDADFVSVEKDHITSDFFLGSVFSMNYYIHSEKMHAGKNYAKISFDFRCFHKEITIIATATPEGLVLEHPIHEKRKLIFNLCKLYEDFRLKAIPVGTWAKESLSLLDQLSDNALDENSILLFRALIYITNKQNQEALWIITDLKRTIADKKGTQWAFLLYLCTLIEREESYVDRITDDIEMIFSKNPDQVILFWILLFLRKDYLTNPTAKLRDIKKWVAAGHKSPFLYIEAYYIYLQDPYFITEFDDFTLTILNWAKKRDALTKDIALQMVHVLEGEKTYNPKAFSLLTACYQIYHEEELLSSMVTYFLKASKVYPCFMNYYEAAIASNLKVAGLFEAYVNSLPLGYEKQLPDLITMYFKYNNSLSADRKALLYANIILYADRDTDTFHEYEKIIEDFALEQLKLKKIDSNLAVCYQLLLKNGVFDKKVAELLSDLICQKKIVLFNPDIKRVLLYQKEFKNPFVAQVKNMVSQVTYTSSETIIFLEDNAGHLIVDDSAYIMSDLLEAEEYMDRLRELAPGNFYFKLNTFLGQEHEKASQADVECCELILDDNRIYPSYRNSNYMRIIQVLKDADKEELLLTHFMEKADLKQLTAPVLSELLVMFTHFSKFEEAFYLMQHTNCSDLASEVLVKICQFMINKLGDEANDFLTILCARLVQEGYLPRDIIFYMLKNYSGDTDTMMTVFKEAFAAGFDTVDFAEKIIVQNIYRDFLSPDIMQVFDTYMVRKTNKMIVEAFLTYEARAYLTDSFAVDEAIFAYINNRLIKGELVNDSMRIALLKYLCTLQNASDQDLSVLDMLLADCVIRNQYFAFFQNVAEPLKIKYHLYDKQFVEYKDKPHQALKINYSLNGSTNIVEDMTEMYDGIYVKQFILFFADQLEFSIYKQGDNTILHSGQILQGDDIVAPSEGRFTMINNIIKSTTYQKKDDLAALLKDYQGLDAITEDLFTIM